MEKTLTDEELIRGLMQTYGLTRAQAERQAAIARGHIPHDVVGLPPAKPLGGRPTT